MSEQVIPIEEIKTDRGLDDFDLAPLMHDIIEHGLVVPILVDHEYVLIDGLRRLEAMKLLNWSHAPAIVAGSYEEAVSNLKLAHEGHDPLRPRRIWEITVGLDGYLKARTRRLRQDHQTGIPAKERRPGKTPRAVRSRELLADALNDVYVAKYATLYRAAEAGGEYAQKLVQDLETGTLTINAAVGRLTDRNNRLEGNVQTLSEQRTLLNGASRTLSGLVKGLYKLGRPIKIPKEEMRALLKELKANRAELVGLIREIEKESNKT